MTCYLKLISAYVLSFTKYSLDPEVRPAWVDPWVSTMKTKSPTVGGQQPHLAGTTVSSMEQFDQVRASLINKENKGPLWVLTYWK